MFRKTKINLSKFNLLTSNKLTRSLSYAKPAQTGCKTILSATKNPCVKSSAFLSDQNSKHSYQQLKRTFFQKSISQIQVSSQNYDRKLSLALEEFKKENPHAVDNDIQKFVEYYSLSKEFSDNWAASSHKVDTLSNKIVLLRMLHTKHDLITPDVIKETLNQLGFKARQTMFLDRIQFHMHLYKKPCQQLIDDLDFCTKIFKQIADAVSPQELATIYADIINSPYKAELKDSSLDFIISGKMNEKIHYDLIQCCTGHFYFSSETSIHQIENIEDFNRTKPIIINMVQALLCDDTWIKKPDLPLERLLEQIKSSENLFDLIKSLYAKDIDGILNMEPWSEVSSKIFYSDDFPSDTKEQLYYLLKDAKKTGIKFEFDEVLIERYVKLYLQKSLIPHLKDHDLHDERGSGCSVKRIFGTSNPTELQLKEHVRSELKSALYNGKYSEVIKGMKKLDLTDANDTAYTTNRLSR